MSSRQGIAIILDLLKVIFFTLYHGKSLINHDETTIWENILWIFFPSIEDSQIASHGSMENDQTCKISSTSRGRVFH